MVGSGRAQRIDIRVRKAERCFGGYELEVKGLSLVFDTIESTNNCGSIRWTRGVAGRRASYGCTAASRSYPPMAVVTPILCKATLKGRWGKRCHIMTSSARMLDRK